MTSQKYVPIPLEIEHIIPTAKGGSDEEDNLWLACAACNKHKGTQVEAVDPDTHELVPLFNPRQQKWTDHFKWSDDAAQIIGLSPTGKATIVALQLNRDIAVVARRNWVVAGWHPPK